jgi:hypothetical protein
MQLADLERETVKWCRQILRNSPTAIRVLKSSLNAVDDGHAGLQVLVCLVSENSNMPYCFSSLFEFSGSNETGGGMFLTMSLINDVHVFLINTNVMGICVSGDWRECNTDLLRYRRGQRREECVHGTTTARFFKVPTKTMIYAG